MTLTQHQAKYLAYELTKRYPSGSNERFNVALMDAQVDLNPHQVESALFAFKSPLSKGAILADEVGLGKTIEAGILLSQLWAERRRKLLIICPANLRKQWSQELWDKYVSFIDPKGLRQIQGFSDPKIQLHKTIRAAIQPKLNDPNIVLNSFIISNTPYNQLTYWKGQESIEDFNSNHVLFQKEQRDCYVRILIEKQIEK